MAATVTDAGPLNRFVISGVNAAGASLGPLQANVVPFVGQDNGAAYQPGLVSGSNRVIDTLDDRLSANIYQVNGKIYGVHTVTPIAGPHAQLQWFVLNAGTGALIESGLIADANFDFYQAAIAANQWGEAVISYNRSGPQAPDGTISIMAQAFTTDAGGGLDPYGAALLLKKSPTDSYALGAAPRVRWGDFAAITIDPLNPRKFWAINEYAAASNNWSTYVSALQLTDPVPVPGGFCRWPACRCWPTGSPWQLDFAAAVLQNAFLPLLAIALVRIAAWLVADDPAVERSWGRIRRGAAPAALGFLLLVPLQIGATWHGIASFSNPRTPQQTAALQRLASHRQAIAAATSSADLRARLQALQAPPLPLARQQLLQSLAKAEVRLQRRFERERGAEPRWALLRQGLQGVLLACGYGLLFVLVSSRRLADLSLSEALEMLAPGRRGRIQEAEYWEQIQAEGEPSEEDQRIT